MFLSQACRAVLAAFYFCVAVDAIGTDGSMVFLGHFVDVAKRTKIQIAIGKDRFNKIEVRQTANPGEVKSSLCVCIETDTGMLSNQPSPHIKVILVNEITTTV